MKRLLFVVLLTGCGCAQQPPLPEAQPLLVSMQSSYTLAYKVEQEKCPMAHLLQKCQAARTMGYNYESAYTRAVGDRTDQSLTEARLRLIAYETTVLELL